MKSFNAIHPTICAGTAFTAGAEGTDATIQLAGRAPRSLGIFIGIRQERSLPWRVLPLFASPPPSGDESFEILSGARYGRTFALASDRWLIGPLVFKLCTPFWKSTDPAGCSREDARLHFAPSLGGFVEYDNTHSEEPVEVIVGAGRHGADFRMIERGMAGFTSSDGFGFATIETCEVRARLGHTPLVESVAESGNHAALVFTIPAKAKRVFPFSIAVLALEDTGCLAREYFSGVEDVLATSLSINAEIVRRSDELDAEWFGASLSHPAKLALSHAVRKNLAAQSIQRSGEAWKLAGSDAAAAAFNATFFPWAVDASQAPSGSWMNSWPGLPN